MAARKDVRVLPLEGFNVVIDCYRKHLRLSRDIAPDHKDDAELADRMGEPENGTCHESWPSKRNCDCPENIARTCAERCRHF